MGVAVKVTLAPAQIVLFASLEAIVTLAGNIGLTVIVILLDVAGEPVRQGLAFDVITQETTCPFVNEVVV